MFVGEGGPCRNIQIDLPVAIGRRLYCCGAPPLCLGIGLLADS